MARTPASAHFHSSQLLRLLHDMAGLDAGVAGGAFAEKFSQWVGFTQAISLAGVHSGAAAQTVGAVAVAQGAATLEQTFAQTRTRLERSIGLAKLPTPDATALTRAEDGAAPDMGAAFEPYRRYYLGQQRELEASAAALRAKAREALGRASPALKQLAALDGALDSMLAEREARLLYTIPKLLKQRFEQLFQTQPPAAPAPPQAWLAGFCSELQAVLLAELELRLQPALGLLEALQQEQTQTA
jgi:hypothetical protein